MITYLSSYACGSCGSLDWTVCTTEEGCDRCMTEPRSKRPVWRSRGLTFKHARRRRALPRGRI